MKSESGIDVYRQPFGVREVRSTATQLLINDKPFYCHGAAKHEDSDVSYCYGYLVATDID